MSRRKKHHTRRRSSRRRRVSGLGDLDFTMIALLVGGAVVGRIVSNKLTASTNATMQKLAPYASFGLGIVLPMVTKSPLIKTLSYGLMAGGGITLLGPTGLKVISGFEQTVGYPPNVLIPYRKVAGLTLPNGQYISKPNFSGSGKSQMNVIGAAAARNMDGAGSLIH